MVKIEFVHNAIPPPISKATPALQSLWEEVREWSHPEFPFLDRDYSPTSQMPAIDYTLWIRGRLLASDAESIHQLMGYISSGGEVWRRQVEDFCRWRIAAFEGQPMEAELRASMLLCYRKGFQSVGFQWIRIWSAVLAAHAAASLGSELSAKMLLCSPTLRLVVANCWLRSEREVFRVDWSLGYGDREYGCSGEWNQHYGEWLAVFDLPTAETLLTPNLLTKDDLLAEAQAFGIELDAKLKKDAMLAEVAKHPQLMALLWTKHGASLCRWNESAKTELKTWMQCYKEWTERAAGIAADAAVEFMAFQNRALPQDALHQVRNKTARDDHDPDVGLLKYIFEIHTSVELGKYRHEQGLGAHYHQMFPALELRPHHGTSASWEHRWVAAGGPPLADGRYVAPRNHPVWKKLGDPALFADGLGLPHYPYWQGFEGYSRELQRLACERLGILTDGQWSPLYFQPGCEIPRSEPETPVDRVVAPEERAILEQKLARMEELLRELGPPQTIDEILGMGNG